MHVIAENKHSNIKVTLFRVCNLQTRFRHSNKDTNGAKESLHFKFIQIRLRKRVRI